MSVRTLGVVGCGLMGSGIAEVAALAGLEVVVVKATAGSIDHAVSRVEGSIQRSVTKGKLAPDLADGARGRLRFRTDLEALAACDLVIESTAESLAHKKRLLADIEQVVPEGTVLASNTSSLPLQQLAGALTTPERFVGMHFFSPVPAMKLVELGRTATTSPDAIACARDLAVALGKTPIVLGDEPGYIVNRLLVPFLCQAIDMLEQGVARAEDIDVAMKLGCGHPLGPLALSDLIGLDIVFAMGQTLTHELRDKRFKPPTLLRRLVLSGHLGKKTKLGLYDYRGETVVQNPEIQAALSAPDVALVG